MAAKGSGVTEPDPLAGNSVPALASLLQLRPTPFYAYAVLSFSLLPKRVAQGSLLSGCRRSSALGVLACCVLSELSIAVLTDGHGNGFALEAVAKDIQRCAPDLIVNLGDQLWGQADPIAAFACQQALGAVEVRGNNDERLTAPIAELHPQLVPLQIWLAQQLPHSELQRIATLPITASLADGAVLATHGTPATPWDSLLIGWNGTEYVRRPEEEIQERLTVPDGTEVVLVGHMHREDVRVLDGRLLVNVGPVSSQGDGDPRARWSLLKRRQGRWEVEMRRVIYDWDAAMRWERQYGPLEDAINHACPPNLPMRDLEVSS